MNEDQNNVEPQTSNIVSPTPETVAVVQEITTKNDNSVRAILFRLYIMFLVLLSFLTMLLPWLLYLAFASEESPQPGDMAFGFMLGAMLLVGILVAIINIITIGVYLFWHKVSTTKQVLLFVAVLINAAFILGLLL